MPASAVSLTLKHRLRIFEEQTLPAARQAFEFASTQLETLRHDDTAWSQLAESLELKGRLQENIIELHAQRAALPGTIESELERPADDSPLYQSWQAARLASEQADKEIETRLTTIREEAARLATEQNQRDLEEAQIAPITAAKQEGKWWTPAWWSALFQNSQTQWLEQSREKSNETRLRLQELHASEQELLASREKNQAILAERRRDLKESELARRDSELASRLSTLESQFAQAGQTWDSALKRLSAGTVLPAEPTREAVQAARTAWMGLLEPAMQEVALRQQWLQALQRAQATLPAQLAASASIVAGITSSLAGDPLFGDQAAPEVFDLLIIEEAQRIPDSELLSLARRARRWLLVGDVAADLPIPPPPPRRNGPARARPIQARPAFQRLWSQLHCDPRCLPARWKIARGRLIACLHTISADQEPWVQNEPVFDRPEIELRIVSPPRKEPIVAEVSFPEKMPFEQAKEFICRELQELSVQAAGPALRWCEQESGAVLELGHGNDCSAISIPLEAGVREMISPCARSNDDSDIPWRTCSLAFDRAEGWDRARAERWVAERLTLRDSGRTSVLYRPYRAREPLARFLSELLYGGLWSVPCSVLSANPLAEVPAVEFVPSPRCDPRAGEPTPATGLPVPDLTARNPRFKAASPRSRRPHG